jgi:hypothetical protein
MWLTEQPWTAYVVVAYEVRLNHLSGKGLTGATMGCQGLLDLQALSVCLKSAPIATYDPEIDPYIHP